MTARSVSGVLDLPNIRKGPLWGSIRVRKFATSRRARSGAGPARSSGAAGRPHQAAVRTRKARGWRRARGRATPLRGSIPGYSQGRTRREPASARDRRQADHSRRASQSRSARRGTPSPVRIASRSPRDRVSNQRIGKSWSRGRSCLAQLPKRSCKITGTFVNDRPLSSDFGEPEDRRFVFILRHLDCISIRVAIRGLSRERSQPIAG